ncbi:hypothetical protein M427DRAFT_335745 [Gonapodya prolifera JEL478]|uniref:Uncharacterized protein n=1 Tax=Gonapodya prolifera (strain JEL478) TaxID=1344416 RepID=A0A139ADI9_GONPJ|nr:hypothetical protein M427DRAFT_335745 [Gonapodya prolifera JEL478]|eukprot:KXS14882.1 hypothetical protein M427DRAFT_335745 [Gonapodya prolifera JEL478]
MRRHRIHVLRMPHQDQDSSHRPVKRGLLVARFHRHITHELIPVPFATFHRIRQTDRRRESVAPFTFRRSLPRPFAPLFQNGMHLPRHACDDLIQKDQIVGGKSGRGSEMSDECEPVRSEESVVGAEELVRLDCMRRRFCSSSSVLCFTGVCTKVLRCHRHRLARAAGEFWISLMGCSVSVLSPKIVTKVPCMSAVNGSHAAFQTL